jgi:hypothetical protein
MANVAKSHWLRVKEQGVVTLIFLAFVSVLLKMTLGYPYRAKVAPLAVGIPTWILLFIQALYDWVPAFEQRFSLARGSSLFTGELASMAAQDQSQPVRRRELALFIWLTALVIAAYVLGLLAAAILFPLAYLRFWSKEKWILAMAYSGVVGLSLYLVLVKLLAAQLPISLVSEWLMH